MLNSLTAHFEQALRLTRVAFLMILFLWRKRGI
jgi:hypothetical protein